MPILVYYYRSNMLEIARMLGFNPNEQASKFSSPREAFEDALLRVHARGLDNFDIAVRTFDGQFWRYYTCFSRADSDGAIFAENDILKDLDNFFIAHSPLGEEMRHIEKLTNANEIVSGASEGLFSSSQFYEVPIENGLVLGIRFDYDFSGNFTSENYFIGKPAAERNLRPGQKINRAITRSFFRAQ